MKKEEERRKRQGKKKKEKDMKSKVWWLLSDTENGDVTKRNREGSWRSLLGNEEDDLNLGFESLG